MCWESFAVVRFDLGALIQGQMTMPKLKSAYTLDPSFKVKLLWPNLKVPISRLLLVLEVWDVKTTYRKTCAGNLLMWSDLTLGPWFKVK